MSSDIQLEIAHASARLIAEEGMPWGPAKQRALRDLGLPPRTPLPSSDLVEDCLREHLALYQSDTQPGELRILRELALYWMERLAEFQPLLTGAVWRGTATHWSDLHLMLFSDDSKAPEIALLNLGESPEPGPTQRDARGRDQHSLEILLRPPRGFDHPVGLHLAIHETLDLRGSLLPDAQGRSLRGNAQGLRKLLQETE
ncbi:MAG: hypothetical protein ACK5O3_03810 [Burkholderiales bacterium]